MKTACSTNMPFAKEAFSTLGDVAILPERGISAKDVRDADILAVRSTTKVGRELLDGSRVRFVGTATIGFDHMDIRYLESKGIAWCAAPGCNANSVSEYIVSALLCVAQRYRFNLAGRTIGVVGVGNVGTLVAKKGEALGMRPMLNDPPRQRGEGRGRMEDGREVAFVPLDALLEQADVVTFHVPLISGGPDATVRMADTGLFRKLKRGCVLINAARGEVADTDALLKAMESGVVSHSVIDTWQGEPDFRRDLLERVDLGTPHIAGHSFEGKVMGTLMVYREACRFLGVKPSWTPGALMPPPIVPQLTVDAVGRAEQEVLWAIVRGIYDIEDDDARLRESLGMDGPARPKHFDGLRRNYPVRREFRFTRVSLANATPSLVATVSALGFQGM